MGKDFADWVYESVLGNMPTEECVPGVENAFADGRPCAVWYADVIEAYQRICDRLGVSDEADVETIMCSLMDITRELCHQMYEYGARFGMQE